MSNRIFEYLYDVCQRDNDDAVYLLVFSNPNERPRMNPTSLVGWARLNHAQTMNAREDMRRLMALELRGREDYPFSEDFDTDGNFIYSEWRDESIAWCLISGEDEQGAREDNADAKQ